MIASRFLTLWIVIRIFGIAALVYVIVRLVFVLALGDVFFYGEELEKGTTAKMLLDGVDIPYARMPFHPYEGGGFVASHLKALMFLLVGENILAHKLAAILWGLGIVLASVGLAWNFGRGGEGTQRTGGGAAMFAGMLVALGPAHLQKQSLLHLGIHYEALLFVGFVFWLGLKVARAPKGDSPGALTLFGLGLASGFGTYFSYQVPIAVLAVIVLLAVTNWRRIFAPSLVLGTLVGLVPLALMYRAVGMEIFDIHGSSVGGEGGWARLLGALKIGLLDKQHLAVFTLLSAGLAVCAGLAHAKPSGDRGRALLLLAGFSALWLVFAGMTGMVEAMQAGAHWVRFIRFAPLVYALLMFVALSAGPALSAKGDQRGAPAAKMARIGATLMVSLGAVHAAQIVDGGDLRRASENLRTLTTVHGYELRGAFVKIVPRLKRENDSPAGYAEAVRPLFGLRVPNAAFLAAEIGSAVSHHAPGFEGPSLAAALAGVSAGKDQVPAEAVEVGLGATVYHASQGNTRGALEKGELGPAAAEAFGRYGNSFVSFAPYVGTELTTARGTKWGASYLRGLGRRIYRSSVMQLYWGTETMLNPSALSAQLVADQGAMAATDAELESLREGIRAAARDYGFPGAIADKL